MTEKKDSIQVNLDEKTKTLEIKLIDQKKGRSFGSPLMALGSLGSLLFFGVFALMMFNPLPPPAHSDYFKTIEYDRKHKVALMQLSGVIGSQITSDTFLSWTNHAEAIGVEGYIIEINSPGGYVMASQEIHDRIKELSEEKPVIAVCRTVAASGAYWSATGADKIMAHESSIVGSIGVRGGYLEFEDLLKKHGVNYVDLHVGEHKTMGSPYKHPSEEELELQTEKMKRVYDKFVVSVAEDRNLEVEYLESLATGEVWDGDVAKNLGLVDYIGKREDAAEWMEDSLGGGYKIKVYAVQQSGFGPFMKNIAHSFGKGLGEGISELIEYEYERR